MPRRRVFISYAHDDLKNQENLNLIELLKTSIETATFKSSVFRDNQIRPGSDWEAVLRHAVDNSFAAIVLISPSYMKSAFALPHEYDKMLKILMERGSLYVCPVLLSAVSPKQLDRFPELMGRQWVGRGQPPLAKMKPELRDQMLQKLANALRVWWILVGNLDSVEPKMAAVATTLLDEIRYATFVGREWLFRKIQERIGNNPTLRAIVIVGAPGIGKTAIATEIGRSVGESPASKHGLRGQLLAQHWCLNDAVDATGFPAGFVRSMAKEFAQNHPTFASVIDVMHVEKIKNVTNKDAAETFIKHLMIPLCSIIRGSAETYFIVVDALDQASTDQSINSIPSMLAEALALFPRQLRLVVTILKDDDALLKFPGNGRTIEHIELDDHAPEGKQDVGIYADAWLERNPQARRLLRPDSLSSLDFAKLLAEASQGNFLIADLLLRELLCTSARHPLNILADPLRSLDNYLERFFRSHVNARNRPEVSWLLGLMIAARTALPREIIEAAFDSDQERVRIAMQAVAALLRDRNGQVSFYHPHLKRWMESRVNQYGSHGGSDPADLMSLVATNVEVAHEKLAGLCCPRQIFETAPPSKPLAPATLSEMQQPKPCDATCSCPALLNDASEAVRTVARYSAEHGPRHYIRNQLLDCAVEFLTSEAADSPFTFRNSNRERHLRMLMIEIGNLFAGPALPILDWAKPAIVDRIIDIVGDQYETEPFIGVARLIVETELQKTDAPRFSKKLIACLKTDYVWRFAVAMAIVERCSSPSSNSLRVDKVAKWIKTLLNRKELHFQELGSYALGLTYAAGKIQDNNQELQALLTSMAVNELYPPRSAFGDTMLNLASRLIGDVPMCNSMAIQPPPQWFNTSPWEHNKLDVVDWAALMTLAGRTSLARGTGVPKKRLQSAYDEFKRTIELFQRLRQQLVAGANILHLLENYWLLGSKVALVRAAEDELRVVGQNDLADIIELLFLHPLWWVTEAAASVLASIADDSESARLLVKEMLDHKSWRVKLGAVEAAFDMRHLAASNIYQQSIKVSWNDKNPRIRGLCAENLIANILEEKDWSMRSQLLEDNEGYLLRWFGDDDCWVLEHPYRLVQAFRAGLKTRPKDEACRDANAVLDAVIDEAVKRKGALLDKREFWEHADRQSFLNVIECLKRGGAPSA